MRISNWILFASTTLGLCWCCGGGLGAFDFSCPVGLVEVLLSFDGRGLAIALSTGLCVTMEDLVTRGEEDVGLFPELSSLRGTSIERRRVASCSSFWKSLWPGGGCDERRAFSSLDDGGFALSCWVTSRAAAAAFLSVVDDLRKTFGNKDVPFWAPLLSNNEISNDFSRRNTGFDKTSALGRCCFSGAAGTGGGPPPLRFPITLMTRSVVESSAEGLKLT